jgi:hypothetical protein
VFRSYLAVSTVSLTNSLAEIAHKSSHKENIRRSKTRRCRIGDQIPYQTPSSFFDCCFFLGVNFCVQTPGAHLNHTVSMAGLPDTAILGPGRGEVLILSEFYMKISTYSPSKKTYFETPLPDLRLDLES